MEIKELAKTIELLVLDVDGTMTDGGMYYSKEGDSLKRFYVKDGMGITLLKRNGIDVAIITGEDSSIVLARAKKLQIEHVIIGCKEKRQALLSLSKRLDIPLENIAYMGDDVNDEEVMKIVGIAACPSDAVNRIRNVSHYVCEARGGHGAVREFIEIILDAQGKSNTLLETIQEENFSSL